MVWSRQGSTAISEDTPGRPAKVYTQWRNSETGQEILLPAEQGPPEGESAPPGAVYRDFSRASTPEEAELKRKGVEAEQKAAEARARRIEIVEYTGRSYPVLGEGFKPSTLRKDEAIAERQTSGLPRAGSWENPLAVSPGFERKLKKGAVSGGIAAGVKGEFAEGEALQFVKVGEGGFLQQSFISGYRSGALTARERRLVEAEQLRLSGNLLSGITAPGLPVEQQLMSVSGTSIPLKTSAATLVRGGKEFAKGAVEGALGYGEVIASPGIALAVAVEERSFGAGRSYFSGLGERVFTGFISLKDADISPRFFGQFAIGAAVAKVGRASTVFKATRATGRGVAYDVTQSTQFGTVEKSSRLFLETETVISKSKPEVVKGVIFEGVARTGAIVETPRQGALIGKAVVSKTFSVPSESVGVGKPVISFEKFGMERQVKSIGDVAAMRLSEQPVFIKEGKTVFITTPETVLPTFEKITRLDVDNKLKIFTEKSSGKGIAEISLNERVITEPRAAFGFAQSSIIEGKVVDIIRAPRVVKSPAPRIRPLKPVVPVNEQVKITALGPVGFLVQEGGAGRLDQAPGALRPLPLPILWLRTGDLRLGREG